MTIELKLHEARRNLALVWGTAGIEYYRNFDSEFEFEKDLGCTEGELWASSPNQIKAATRCVRNAVDILESAIGRHEHLSNAVSLYFRTLDEEYWFMNLTYTDDLLTLEEIVVDYYDQLRTREESREISEKSADLCEKEYELFLAENNTVELFTRLMKALAGSPA